MLTKIKKTIPNAITLANLFLGFVAVILLALSLGSPNEQYVKIACYLVLVGAVLDSIDGKVARKLNISSDFGKEIDSLADLISFCLVPSFLVFVWYNKLDIEYLSLIHLILLSSFPIIFGAIRLAKYNALREMRNSEKYLGLPTPANAILICSLILFTSNIPYRAAEVFFVGGKNNIFFYLNNFLSKIFVSEYMILFISIFSSILLMSNVNYDKFPLISFKINKKNSLDLINVIVFSIILITSILYGYYDIVLLFFILIYIFGNLIKYFLKILLIK